MTDADTLATSALRLRAWAIGALASPAPAAPPAESADAWRLFLLAERCALPLQARLDSAGVRPDAAAAVLRERSMVELQRVLSAKGELRRVAAVLRRQGWPGLVLKGAACALTGEPVDLADVDVLVKPEHAAPLAEALAAAGGHRAVGGHVEAGRPGRWHLAGLAAPSTVPVEIHYDLPLVEAHPWDGSVETPEPGLRALSPSLHLWHVLVHGSYHHPERCGSLRELLLVRAAVRGCSPAELAAVEARADASPARVLLRRLLAWAAEPGGGGDPFGPAAALRCLFLQERADAGAGRWQRALSNAAFSHAVGCGQPRLLWGGDHLSGVFTSYDAALAPFHRLARAAGRAAQLAVVTPRARFLAAHARRLAGMAATGG